MKRGDRRVSSLGSFRSILLTGRDILDGHHDGLRFLVVNKEAHFTCPAWQRTSLQVIRAAGNERCVLLRQRDLLILGVLADLYRCYSNVRFAGTKACIFEVGEYDRWFPGW